ncbi:MAG: MipA/OmpV family protein [Pontixanthobacter sp.]
MKATALLHSRYSPIVIALSIIAVAASMPAHAQDGRQDDGERRTRIALGPQLVPAYPGADGLVLRPLIDFSRADAGDDFAFEAPDESIGFSLFRTGDLSFGPSANFEGERSSGDVGGLLPEVGFTFEIGGFAQYQATDNLRFRADARQAINGHDGFITVLGADFVQRDGDDHVFSIGPRVTLTDGNYQSAYFGVDPQDAAISGLPAYDADGGLQAVGVTAGYIQQFSPKWGLYSYAKYERLVGDAEDSPVTALFGSKDQVSGGVALSYTFGVD